MLGHWRTPPLGESWFEIREFQSLWPIVFIWGSLNCEYFKDLVDFWVADEKGSPLCHFSKYTTHWPYVNWCWVLLSPKENLWGSVPKCDDFMGVSFDWETESSCQTEICELNISFLIYQKVLRLKISVHNSVSVAVGGCLEDLVREFLDGIWG